MTIIDALYLSVILIGLAIESFVLWPRFLRRSEAEPARARLSLWSGTIFLLWALVAAGVALWLSEGRSWTALLPAIAAHMLIDASEGFVAWLALRDVPGPQAARAGVAARYSDPFGLMNFGSVTANPAVIQETVRNFGIRGVFLTFSRSFGQQLKLRPKQMEGEQPPPQPGVP